MRYASNPQYNQSSATVRPESNVDSRPPFHNYNNRGRGRGRGGFRGQGRNNEGRPHNNQYVANANAYLNQNLQNNVHVNNSNEPGNVANGSQNAQNNSRQQIAHNNNHNNNNYNRNNNRMPNSNDEGNSFLTFTGSFYRMNKVESDCWQTAKTLLPVIILKLGPKRIPVSFLLNSG